MSDHRRSSSRTCVTKKYETEKKSRKGNKRTRLDSATSNKLNQKKKKEIISDDDDIQEILTEKKGFFIFQNNNKTFTKSLSFV